MTTVLKKGWGEGQRGINAPTARHPKLSAILTDIAADLAALRPATIASPDAATQGGAYVQADVQSIATLANEIKTALNALAAATPSFTAE
jgi:hypothetical protein